MRMLIVSDIHGNVKYLEKILEKENHDLLIVAGDMTSYSGRYKDIISRLIKHTAKGIPVIAVPGNADPKEIMKFPSKDLRIIHKDVCEVNDVVFLGIGGGTGFWFWEYPRFTDEHLGEILAEIENKYDITSFNDRLIIVSHTPPYGTSVDILYSGEHVGSKFLREFIIRHSPIAVICGHVHESRGSDNLGDTLIINPGPAMAGYFAVLEVENGKTKYFSLLKC
jgi:hypothetical protein